LHGGNAASAAAGVVRGVLGAVSMFPFSHKT
jgi:hypothetical protein